jgi:hypothetical protein
LNKLYCSLSLYTLSIVLDSFASIPRMTECRAMFEHTQYFQSCTSVCSTSCLNAKCEFKFLVHSKSLENPVIY